MSCYTTDQQFQQLYQKVCTDDMTDTMILLTSWDVIWDKFRHDPIKLLSKVSIAQLIKSFKITNMTALVPLIEASLTQPKDQLCTDLYYCLYEIARTKNSIHTVLELYTKVLSRDDISGVLDKLSRSSDPDTIDHLKAFW